MSKSWPAKPLGDLCKLINGRAFKPSDWGNEGLPIVRIQNLNDPKKPFNYFKGHVTPNHSIDTGEVLLSWSGTPGTSFGCFRWNRGPGVLNQHIFKVIVDETQIDGDFYIAAVNSRLEEMIAKAHGGVGLRHITKSKLEAIHLPVPPLAEQRRIVTRIKECTERIDELSSLIPSMASDFLTLKYSLLFGEDSNKLKWVTVGELVDLVKETESVTKNKIYEFAGVRSFGRGVFSGSTRSSSDFQYSQVRRLREKDFIYPKLMAWEGAFGIVPQGLGGRVVSPEFMVFRAKEEKLLPEILDTYFRSPFCLEDVCSGSTGSNQRRRRLNPKEFLKLKIPVPSMEHQLALREFHRIEQQMLESRSQHENELIALRDAILRKAFAGEL